jgi:hypothetical protein
MCAATFFDGGNFMLDRDNGPPGPSRWDLIGAATSLACAAHCGLGPLMVIMAPLLGLVATDDETLHRVVMVVAPPAAVLAFARGYAAHRRRGVLLLGAIGVSLIAGAALPWIESVAALEGIMGAAGGALLFAAHLRNRRLCSCATACARAATSARAVAFTAAAEGRFDAAP